MVQVMLKRIFRTDNLYVEYHYTNFLTWRESCFEAMFVTDRLYVERQTTT
jgi:hypothetical protein